MIRTTSCPDAESWQALLADSTAHGSAELEAHLSSCTKCQRLLDDLAVGTSGWLRDAGRLANSMQVDPDVTRTLTRLLDDEYVDPPIRLDFLTPSSTPGVLGTLGRYQVLEVLGRGAFGIVLKALDPDLLRPVAIKVLAPYLAPSGTARQRFLREARAAAAVSHDHVVTIHAVEPADGLPYLVMEFVKGVSLQGRLDRDGPLPPRDIARIGHQAACGLTAAHEMGLVHRDIKPANILLENGVERVKITDFGLARAADDARLTQSGVAAGTPLYMSPEQAHGETIDARSDLFSLGSVLYTLATGFPPFRADTTMGVLNRITNHSPRPIRETNPDFPAALESIIMKLLEKDPARRFQLAADVSGQLTAFLGGHKVQSTVDEYVNSPDSAKPRVKQSRRGGWRFVLPILAAMIVVGVVLVFRTPKGTLRVEVDDPNIKVALDGDELTIKGAGVEEVRLKPGTYVVTASKDGKPAKVDPEIVTITKNGVQVVKVTFEANPAASDPRNNAFLISRLGNLLPNGDPEQVALIHTAWQEAKNPATVARPAADPPVPQVHQSYPKLQKLADEIADPQTPTERLKPAAAEAYELAGKIVADTNKSMAIYVIRNSGKKMDAVWGGRLDGLAKRFQALVNSLSTTAAGALMLLPGPITDYEKATTGVPGEHKSKVAKLLTLRDQFALLLPRAQANAIRLNELKDAGAANLTTTIAASLDTSFATLGYQLTEMEKIARDLGVKAHPAIPPAALASMWETRQKQLIAEIQALIARISKTRTGSVLATTLPGSDYSKIELTLDSRSGTRIKRLLTVRDEFSKLVPDARKGLERWEKAQLEFANVDIHYQAGTIPAKKLDEAKLEMRQAERALQVWEDSLNAMAKEFRILGDELGINSSGAEFQSLEADLKKMTVDYEALLARLAKDPVGRVVALFKYKGWVQSDVMNRALLDGSKLSTAVALLNLRDEFINQTNEAESARQLVNSAGRSRDEAEAKKQPSETVAAWEEMARKSTAELKVRVEAMRGYLADLTKITEEIVNNKR